MRVFWLSQAPSVPLLVAWLWEGITAGSGAVGTGVGQPSSLAQTPPASVCQAKETEEITEIPAPGRPAGSVPRACNS